MTQSEQGKDFEAGDLSSWLKHPHRIAVDGKGYVWRAYEDDEWSMAPVNPDNSPIPEPITYYISEKEHQADLVRRLKKLSEKGLETGLITLGEIDAAIKEIRSAE